MVDQVNKHSCALSHSTLRFLLQQLSTRIATFHPFLCTHCIRPTFVSTPISTIQNARTPQHPPSLPSATPPNPRRRRRQTRATGLPTRRLLHEETARRRITLGRGIRHGHDMLPQPIQHEKKTTRKKIYSHIPPSYFGGSSFLLTIHLKFPNLPPTPSITMLIPLPIRHHDRPPPLPQLQIIPVPLIIPLPHPI